MKKKIVIIAGLVLFICMLLLMASAIKNLIKKERLAGIQNSLSTTMINLGTYRAENKSTVLVFFNSECEHCQWEIKEIQQNIEQFKPYQLFFVSFEPREQALNFLEQHNLETYYLETKPEKVMTTFSGGVPQTFIYKKDELVKHFKGEVKIEGILNALSD